MDIDILKVLSSIVGMIGGFLGIFVFIDNYVLKFKPRLNISNRLFFCYKTLDKYPHIDSYSHIKVKPLESIILKIEVINGRNKIGRIDDLAVRVYDSDSTFPSGYMFYSENVIERLPSKCSSLNYNENNFDSFSPISILGRSTKNFVIEFKLENHMRAHLNSEGILKLDLLYFLPNKGWKYVGTFRP